MKRWTWEGAADPVYGPSPSLTIDGNKLVWNLDTDYDMKRGSEHAEQSYEDFRTYGPAWTTAPKEVMAEVLAQPGLENPPWLTPGYDPYSPVWNAIERGDESAALASLGAEDPRRRYRHATTLLMHAAAKGMADVAEYLLRSGADVHALNELGQEPLFFAVNRFHASLPVVELLVEAGAQQLNEAAVWATNFNNPEVTDWLVTHGAQPPNPDYFFTITSRGWLPVMRTLLARGADPNRRNSDGVTALMWARSPESTELLLEAGADIHVKTPYGDTALSLACSSGLAWKVARLLKAGADPNSRGFQYEFHKTPGAPVLRGLLVAERSPEIVEMLRAAGADPDLQ